MTGRPVAIVGCLWLLAACNDRETLVEAASPQHTPAVAPADTQAASPVEPAAPTSAPDPKEDADALVERAQAALDAHDAGAAESLAREALTQNEKDADAIIILGDAALARHRPADALAAYERAQALDGDNGWAIVRASEALEALGRTGEARTRLRAYVAAHPDTIADVFDALGWRELDSHDPVRAKSAFSQGLKISNESDADAWYGLAVVAAGTENAAEVGRTLRRLFALDPQRRTEALADEAFEPVRQSVEWRELFPAPAKPAGNSTVQGALQTRDTRP
jgi:tetratricopeptide (TPR) repeat protein